MNKTTIILASLGLLMLTSCGTKDKTTPTPVVQIENPRPSTGSQNTGYNNTGSGTTDTTKTTYSKKTTSTKKYVTRSKSASDASKYNWEAKADSIGHHYSVYSQGAYMTSSYYGSGYVPPYTQVYTPPYPSYGMPGYVAPQYTPSSQQQGSFDPNNNYIANYNTAVQVPR